MSKKTSRKDYLIGTAIVGAVSAVCVAGMKLVDKHMKQKETKKEK